MPSIPGNAAPGAAVRGKGHILVITANTDDLYRTSMLLQRFAYPVFTAQTMQQAFDMVSVTMPSLVIADLVLPDTSGLDLLRKLGAGARALPFILLLPAADAQVEQKHVELGGAVPCLAKPVQAEELFRLVQAAIEPTPRATIRIQARLPVTVNRSPFDPLKGEYIIDLSEDGLYIRTLRPLPRNDRVTVQLEVGGRVITAEATVIYVHRPLDGLFREPGMALKFQRIAPVDREAIRQHIHDAVTKGIEDRKA
jgi:DNA-binding response OmpR family regulator